MLRNVYRQTLFTEVIQLDDRELVSPSVHESLRSVLLADTISPSYNFDFPPFRKSAFDAFEKTAREFCFCSISAGENDC
jgi:hypothetical protein